MIGNFSVGENLQVGGVTFATVSATQSQNGSVASNTHCNNLLLAANYQRGFIQAVPGSGSITGVWVYNSVVYAFRNNAAGTANLMYQATSAGWVLVPFGSEIHVGTLNWTATVTMSTASPSVVTWNSPWPGERSAGTVHDLGRRNVANRGSSRGDIFRHGGISANTFPAFG